MDLRRESRVADDQSVCPAVDHNGTSCHYFLKAGKIAFCGDCRHALSGKTVDLPPWPYSDGEYGGVED